MKKLLLMGMMLFGMNSTVSAGDISLVDFQDGADWVKFLMKGKGSSCVGEIGVDQIMISTTCIKKKNKFCTKNKKICKSEKEIFNSISSIISQQH